jgi:hypothetical protein
LSDLVEWIWYPDGFETRQARRRKREPHEIRECGADFQLRANRRLRRRQERPGDSTMEMERRASARGLWVAAAFACAACAANHPISVSTSTTSAAGAQPPGRDSSGEVNAEGGAAGASDASATDAIAVWSTVDGGGSDGAAGGGATDDGPGAGSDAVDSEGGADAPSAQQIVDALHTTACRREVRCGRQATVADCLGSTLAPLTREMAGGLGAGTVSYDARAAQVLLDWLANLGCGRSSQGSTTALATLQSLCAATFRIAGATGDACQFDDECAPGLVCSTTQNGASNPPGTCAAPIVPDGQSCDRSFGQTLAGLPCGAGSYCGVIDEPGTPLCAPLPTVKGQACQAFEGTGCGNGLVCLYDVSTFSTVVGMCGTLPAVGEACDPSNGCEDPTSYCDPMTRTCTARLGLGAACQPEALDVPLGGECAPNLICDRSSETCVPLPGPGGACDSLCLGDLSCDNDTHTCDFSGPPGLGSELPTCP